MGCCLKSRREWLHTVFKESAPQLTLVRSQDFTKDGHLTPQYINTMMHEAMVSGVAKGLLFKSLDSVYEAGCRSEGWQIHSNTFQTQVN